MIERTEYKEYWEGRLKDLVDRKIPVSVIAYALGMSEKAIFRWMDRNGIDRYTPTDKRILMALKMDYAGYSRKEIAEKVGVTQVMITRWCNQYINYRRGGLYL